MDHPISDRRRDARFGHPIIAGTRALLRPGCVVSLIDLSAGGALVEGPKPLRPGSRIHLQLLTDRGAFGIAAVVRRCAVSALDATEGARYRGALEFDVRHQELWEGETLDGYVLPLIESKWGGPSGQHLPPDDDCEDRARS